MLPPLLSTPPLFLTPWPQDKEPSSPTGSHHDILPMTPPLNNEPKCPQIETSDKPFTPETWPPPGILSPRQKTDQCSLQSRNPCQAHQRARAYRTGTQTHAILSTIPDVNTHTPILQTRKAKAWTGCVSQTLWRFAVVVCLLLFACLGTKSKELDSRATVL